MKIVLVTSLSPRHIDRQTPAIESWKALSWPIVSLNATEEADAVHAAFPAVAVKRVQRSAILRRLAALLSGSGRAARLYVDAAARGGRASQRLMRALAWAISDLAKGSGLKVLLAGSREAADLELELAR